MKTRQTGSAAIPEPGYATVPVKDHLVFEKMKGYPFLSQHFFYFKIPCYGIRLVVLVGISRFYAELLQERHPDFTGFPFPAIQSAQAGFLIAGALSHGPGQVREPVVNESYMGIVCLEFVKNVVIENEHRQHRVWS